MARTSDTCGRSSLGHISTPPPPSCLSPVGGPDLTSHPATGQPPMLPRGNGGFPAPRRSPRPHDRSHGRLPTALVASGVIHGGGEEKSYMQIGADRVSGAPPDGREVISTLTRDHAHGRRRHPNLQSHMGPAAAAPPWCRCGPTAASPWRRAGAESSGPSREADIGSSEPAQGG
jgi:hypothetical protein